MAEWQFEQLFGSIKALVERNVDGGVADPDE